MFESLPDSVANALGIMKPEPPPSAFIKPDEEVQVYKSRPHPALPRIFVYKWEGRGIAASPFWFHQSGRIETSVLHGRRSIAMKLLQRDK